VTYTPGGTGPGAQTVSASYLGDAGHLGSAGSTSLTVTRRATSTTVSCVDSEVDLGHSTTCTATVTDVGPGTPITPAGAVKFTVTKGDTVSPTSCTLSGSGGSASCSVQVTPGFAGSSPHSVVAKYAAHGTEAASSGQTSYTVLIP
jgi:hypothetical protein